MDELDAATATVTAFRVEAQDGGYRFSWGDDPLDFIWQTEAQTCDLVNRICEALTSPPHSPE